MRKLSGSSPLKVKVARGDPDTELGFLVAMRVIEARK